MKRKIVEEGGKIVEVDVPDDIVAWDDMSGFAALGPGGRVPAAVLPQFKAKTFNGRTGSGAVSVPGLAAGDTVVAVWCVNDILGGGDVMGGFESTISSDDQIQQLNSGLWSLKTFIGLFA